MTAQPLGGRSPLGPGAFKLNYPMSLGVYDSYHEAQNVIDGKPLGGVPVSPEHDASALEHDIKSLFELAKQLRERRFQGGALGGESLRLSFTLDENGMPTDCGSDDRNDAQNLIEEVCITSSGPTYPYHCK